MFVHPILLQVVTERQGVADILNPHTPLPLCDLAEPAEDWKEETKVA